jgi:cold shock CspA family protein
MVQVPIEIAFHNIPSIPWAEEEIRGRIAKLEQIFERLVACRVRVDQRNDNLTHTIPPVVRIEMGIPGRPDLVVSHEPDYLLQKFKHPDLRHAINEAFRIAESQLAEYKAQLTDRTREPFRHANGQALGQVAEIDPSGDFGFILTSTGSMLHFHRDSVVSGDFDKLRRGREVYYVEAMGDTGPTANKVRVKNGDSG